MWFLEHEVVAGTIWWGQRKGKGTRPKDEAVLAAVADQVCTEARAGSIASRHGWPLEKVLDAWRQLVSTREVGRAYGLHLIERIEVHGERIVVTPKGGGRKEPGAVSED